MNLRGQDIGEAVEGQGRLVRQNALCIGPQPCGNEFLVLNMKYLSGQSLVGINPDPRRL